ncbi:MAG: PKD domain-containing protein, partial [Bacteroidia bacterium]|nr:PKD domain-containing protein [Bacteroidia bacterium]
MIAKNNEGCVDTARKDDYILVKGPLPQFKMENYVGCEPLQVTFTDQSIDGSRFFMNYNDGSSLDSSKIDSTIGTHTYVNRTTNNLRQSILPSMIVYDSLGCAAVFTPEDSIVIYKKPIVEPHFVNGTDVCLPFNMLFEDTGRFSSTWTWSLDATAISTNRSDSIMQSNPGFYDLELLASNVYGCTDTLYQTMQVYEKPVIDIDFSDTICLNKVVDFNGILTGNSPVQFYEWNFGETGDPDNINTTSLNPRFTYTSKGSKHITLIAGLNNGCSDSSSVDIVLTGEDEIDNPQINFVSFSDNYTLEINYEASNYDKFLEYLIQRSDGSYYTVSEKSTIEYTDVFAAKPVAPMCYDLKVKDYCDLQGLASTPHCFIYLTASSINPYENILEWTAYEGWPSVAEYNIFREDENGVYVRIATVPGDQTTFVDVDLCDQDY